MKHDVNVYQLTETEKAELVEKLSQDVTFLDEESLFEIEDYFENVDDFETLDEVG